MAMHDRENDYEDDDKVKRLFSPLDDFDEGASVDLPAELPPPPDGGWGWVIVFASFICNLIVDGVVYAFSPYLIVLSQKFDEPQGSVAWISSLMCGCCLMAGPIVSGLVNKFGCRIICISGAIVASIGFASSTLAKSILILKITQGIITGFGLGMIYLPAIVCVGYYFESKRAMATGMAVCGSGVGTILFPPLAKFLIANLGWQGSNLCFAGAIFCLCFMGALMRPLEVQKMKRSDLFQRLAEEKKLALEIGSLYGSEYFCVARADGTIEKRIRPGSNIDPGVHSNLNLSGYNLSPVETALALPIIEENLPTIEEGVQLSKDVPKEKFFRQISADEDNKSMTSRSVSRKFANGSAISLSDANKILRNMSQQSMDKNNENLAMKVGSVHSFERKLSKRDLVNMMKVS